jgi:hypothetical protein
MRQTATAIAQRPALFSTTASTLSARAASRVIGAAARLDRTDHVLDQRQH